MADNIDVTAGSGTTVATDQVGTVHYQKVKLINGTAESETPIAVDVGAKANAIRTAPANDITDATYIGDIKFGEALPAGTNAIGKLAANSGVDIGDVDVTSSALPTGAATSAKQDDIIADTAAIETATEAIQAAVEGTLSVDLGVNNDVTLATLPDTAGGDLATISSDTTSIDTNTGTIAGDTTSIDGKITACNTGAVVLAAGSAAIGKLVANDGVDIGDVTVNNTVTVDLGANNDVTMATLPDTVSGDLAAINSALSGTLTVSGTNLDTRDLHRSVDNIRVTHQSDLIYNDSEACTPKFAVIDCATGDTTIVAAVGGKKIRVLQAIGTVDAAGTVRFESGAGGTALTGVIPVGDTTGFVLPYSPVGWFETNKGQALSLELGTSGTFDGVLTYIEVTA